MLAMLRGILIVRVGAGDRSPLLSVVVIATSVCITGLAVIVVERTEVLDAVKLPVNVTSLFDMKPAASSVCRTNASISK